MANICPRLIYQKNFNHHAAKIWLTTTPVHFIGYSQSNNIIDEIGIVSMDSIFDCLPSKTGVVSLPSNWIENKEKYQKQLRNYLISCGSNGIIVYKGSKNELSQSNESSESLKSFFVESLNDLQEDFCYIDALSFFQNITLYFKITFPKNMIAIELEKYEFVNPIQSCSKHESNPQECAVSQVLLLQNSFQQLMKEKDVKLQNEDNLMEMKINKEKMIVNEVQPDESSLSEIDTSLKKATKSSKKTSPIKELMQSPIQAKNSSYLFIVANGKNGNYTEIDCFTVKQNMNENKAEFIKTNHIQLFQCKPKSMNKGWEYFLNKPRSNDIIQLIINDVITPNKIKNIIFSNKQLMNEFLSIDSSLSEMYHLMPFDDFLKKIFILWNKINESAGVQFQKIKSDSLAKFTETMKVNEVCEYHTSHDPTDCVLYKSELFIFQMNYCRNIKNPNEYQGLSTIKTYLYIDSTKQLDEIVEMGYCYFTYDETLKTECFKLKDKTQSMMCKPKEMKPELESFANGNSLDIVIKYIVDNEINSNKYDSILFSNKTTSKIVSMYPGVLSKSNTLLDTFKNQLSVMKSGKEFKNLNQINNHLTKTLKMNIIHCNNHISNPEQCICFKLENVVSMMNYINEHYTDLMKKFGLKEAKETTLSPPQQQPNVHTQQKQKKKKSKKSEKQQLSIQKSKDSDDNQQSTTYTLSCHNCSATGVDLQITVSGSLLCDSCYRIWLSQYN